MRYFILIFSLITTSNIFAANSIWPRIQQIDMTVGLNWKDQKLYVSIPIFSLEGKVVYRLICRGVSEDYLDPLSTSLDINYVGPMMCILNDGDEESEVSLLREGADKPWFTRGQFTHRELVGECGEYPEYGRLRHFRLRGFVLTLEVIDPEVLTNGKVGYFNFRVTAHNEATITSAISEPSGHKDPRYKGDICGAP